MRPIGTTGHLHPLDPMHPIEKPRKRGAFFRVSDGTRTHDRLDHNQELYQLSYAHRGI